MSAVAWAQAVPLRWEPMKHNSNCVCQLLSILLALNASMGHQPCYLLTEVLYPLQLSHDFESQEQLVY